MFRIIRLLFTGYWDVEKWETIEKRDLENIKTGSRGTRFVLKSTRTGLIHFIDVI